MKIGEAELATGITAKNIRFYESEGLLHPARAAGSGYRDYTADEIATLKQIKLLRELGVSLRHIKMVLDGEITLRDCMDIYTASLDDEIAQLQAVRGMCTQLRTADLGTLNVDRCLREIEDNRKRGARFVDVVYDCLTYARNFIPTPAFHFEPDDPVTTPAEFTDALAAYARDTGKTLNIVHVGMEPVAWLDGQKYLFLLEPPRTIEVGGPLRLVFGGLLQVNKFGYKIVYAYPYQL